MHHPNVSHEFGNGLAANSAWFGARHTQLCEASAQKFTKIWTNIREHFKSPLAVKLLTVGNFYTIQIPVLYKA